MARNEETALAQRLGALIRQARYDAGLSQIELAKRVGVAQTHLSRWELGKSIPRVLEVRRLEDVLQLRQGDLFIRSGLISLDPMDAERALETDTRLDDQHRSLLLAYFRAAISLIEHPPAPRQRRRGERD